MELRRFKDIIAFKWGQNAPLAFHAENMSVAEISSEAFLSLPLTHLNSTQTNGEFAPQVLTEIQAWEAEVDPNAHDIVLSKKVKSLTINITQICNLHCTYCAAGGDGSYGDPIAKINIEKTLPQLRLFLDKLTENESFHLTFLGGEPLLYPEAILAIGQYCQLFTAGKKIQLSFSIITNGTLITGDLIEKLSPLKPQYTLSFDGPQEIHDLFRPQKNGKSSYNDVFKGLQALAEKPSARGRLLIHSVFTKNQTDVVKVYNFFRQFPVDAYEFTYDVTCDDPRGLQQFSESMAQVAHIAFQNGGEEALRKITLFDQYFSLLDQQSRNQNHCGSGKTLLSIDSKNRVFTCPLEVNERALALEPHLTDLAQSELSQKNLIDLNNCQTCWARNLCGGGCMYIHKMTTGEKHKKSPNYCQKQRDLISITLLYYYKARS